MCAGLFFFQKSCSVALVTQFCSIFNVDLYFQVLYEYTTIKMWYQITKVSLIGLLCTVSRLTVCRRWCETDEEDPENTFPYGEYNIVSTWMHLHIRLFPKFYRCGRPEKRVCKTSIEQCQAWHIYNLGKTSMYSKTEVFKAIFTVGI